MAGVAALPGWLRRHSQLNFALIDQAMASGSNFVMNLLLARQLGIQEFGRFVLGWMAVLVAASLQEGLIISPMMSLGPSVAAVERGSYFTTVFCHQLAWVALGFLVLLAGVTGSAVVAPSWRIEGLALPLAAAAAAHLLQEFVRRYLYTRDRAPTALWIDAIYYLGRIAALLCLFRLGAIGTAGALWTIAGAAALSFSLGFMRFEPLRFSRASLSSVTRRHWRVGRWLGGSAILFWACNNFFILSAGALLGAWAVGAIKAAQNIMGVTNILYQGIYNVVIIGAAKQLQTGGGGALAAYLRQVAAGGSLAIVAIGVVAGAAPGMWLRLFYGEPYAAYGHLVQWYALAYLIGFLHVPLRVGLYVTENTRAVFLGYAAVAAFSITSAYPAIRLLGLNGAMAGPVAAETLMCVVLYPLLKRRLSGIAAAEPPATDQAPAFTSRLSYVLKKRKMEAS